MYLTEDEIFDDLLLYCLPEDMKLELIKTDEDDLILYHHSFGRWIRNHYRLWEKDNPHVDLTDSFHEKFPDQVSQRIIERLWTHLSGKKRTFTIEVKEETPGNYTVRKVPLV